MKRSPSAVAAALSLLPLAGCCTISQGMSALFCGPRPALPRRSYLTPEQGLDTLLGAISSDDARTIFDSIGPDLKRSLGVSRFEWEIAWAKIKEQTPGIHIADQATRSDPIELPPTRNRPFLLVRYDLELPGTKIAVTFRRYSFHKTLYRVSGTDEIVESSAHVENLRDLLKLKEVDDEYPIEVHAPGTGFQLSPSEVLSVGVGIEWLVYGFAINPPETKSE